MQYDSDDFYRIATNRLSVVALVACVAAVVVAAVVAAARV